MKQLKKGFSLIQLIIVIAVVAVLSAVAIGAYFGVTESAKHSKAETEALQVFKEIQLKTIGNFTIHDVNTKVSYTENGLQFNGIYDDISLDRFAKEIFGENTNYEFIPATNLSEISDVSNNPRVIFFAGSSSNFAAESQYFGYIPADLSKNYIKYIEFSTGKYTHFESGNFVMDNLPSTYKKDYILPSSFINEVENKSEKHSFGTASLNAEYFGYGKIQNNSFVFEYDTESSFSNGLYSNKSAGLIRYLAVDFNQEVENYKSTVLNISGTVNKPYEGIESVYTSRNLDFETNLEIAGNHSFYNIEDEGLFYLRLHNFENQVSVKRVVVYYDSSEQVPNRRIDHLFLNTSKVFLEPGSSYKLNVSIYPFSYSEYGYSFKSLDPSIATVDDEGNITAQNKSGLTKIVVSSKFNEHFKKYCEVKVKTHVTSYTGGLINNINLYEEGTKVIFILELQYACSSVEKYYFDLFKVENSNFKNYQEKVEFTDIYDVLFFELEKIDFKDDRYEDCQFYSIFTRINGEKKYITANPYRNKDTKIYLENDYIIDDLPAGVFKIDSYPFTGSTNMLNICNNRTLSYSIITNKFGFFDESDNYYTYMYGINFDKTDKTVQFFSLKVENDDENKCFVGEQVKVVVDWNSIFPGYAEPFDLKFASSDTSIIEVDENTGVCKGIKQGTTIISATPINTQSKTDAVGSCIINVFDRGGKVSGYYNECKLLSDITKGKYLFVSFNSKKTLLLNDENSFNDYFTSTRVEVDDYKINPNGLNATIIEIDEYLDGYSVKINGKFLKDNPSVNVGMLEVEELSDDCVFHFEEDTSMFYSSLSLKSKLGRTLYFDSKSIEQRFIFVSENGPAFSTNGLERVNFFKYYE